MRNRFGESSSNSTWRCQFSNRFNALAKSTNAFIAGSRHVTCLRHVERKSIANVIRAPFSYIKKRYDFVRILSHIFVLFLAILMYFTRGDNYVIKTDWKQWSLHSMFFFYAVEWKSDLGIAKWTRNKVKIEKLINF